MSEDDYSGALEDLLDNLELLSNRKDDQRTVIVGSDVRLNIYDMVSCSWGTVVIEGGRYGGEVFLSSNEILRKHQLWK